jgi:hypothetical protein
MPEVIANTSPLQYLFQTRLLELLPTLYGRIIVPRAVVNELKRGQSLGCALPVVNELSRATIKTPKFPILMPLATGLGAGESEVLALANETPGALAILDDKRARQHARVLGIAYTGTLGILLKAKQSETLNALGPVLEQLETLGFHFHPKTRDAILRLGGELS